ncbi:hypothetical protein ACLMJK_006283 [Lecanora helva]
MAGTSETINASDESSPLVIAAPAEQRPAVSGLSPTNLNAVFPGTDQERHSFHCFRTRVTTQLSGYFDEWFWKRTVLQAAHQETIIRHAILALGSLVERVEHEDHSEAISLSSPSEGVFALQHYNHAIRELKLSAQRRQLSLDVLLITCLLFASFEVVRRHHGSAVSHIGSGIKVLSEYQDSAEAPQLLQKHAIGSVPYIDLQRLEVLFGTLNSHARHLGPFPRMTIRNLYPEDAENISCTFPPAFSSLDEAHASFQYIFNKCVYEWQDIRDRGPTPQLVAEHRAQLRQFDQWQSSMRAFLRNLGKSLSLTTLRVARVLQLNLDMLALQLEVGTELDSSGRLKWETPIPEIEGLRPIAWDSHIPRFQKLISLARVIVDHAVTCHAAKTDRLRNFALDTNVVPALYFVATSCRDPIIRRDAVALLYALPPEEGLWPSAIVARICERVVKIEEEGLGQVNCCEDVPEHARIQWTRVSFDVEGQPSKISYQKGRIPGRDVRDDYFEYLQW